MDELQAYATIQAMMKATVQAGDKGIISLLQESDICMARLQVERGILEEVDVRSSSDPNERCFKLTVAGVESLQNHLDTMDTQ